jgi:hypothetical protein
VPFECNCHEQIGNDRSADGRYPIEVIEDGRLRRLGIAGETDDLA